MKYVVGDIHGNYLALMDILNQINFDYDKDTLITIGDYFDGWSQSFEVIEELMKIKNLISIKGNHDEWFLEFIKDTFIKDGTKNYDFYKHRSYESWVYHGGKATILSYSQHLDKLDEHYDWCLKNLKNYYIDDDNNLFIHAGYSDVIPEKDENLYDSDFLWDRSYVNNKLVYPYYNDQYKGDRNFNKVFIGHTPTINFKDKINGGYMEKIMNKANIHLIDCGAGFNGYLACMNIDTGEEFYSSKKAHEYYPNEKGRN